MRSDKLQQVLDAKLVAVVRAAEPTHLISVLEALFAGGITVAEVTFTVPGAAEVIREASRQLGGKMLLGAGTVLDAETARVAILSGAEFLVSPTLSLPVIQLARRYGKLCFPGAYTPTEILTAWEAGADVVKVFPAECLGPKFFQAMRGPLPQVKLMPTGGVDLTTAREYLKAGAVCLGLGSQLVDPVAIQQQNFARITELARQYVEVVSSTRGAA